MEELAKLLRDRGLKVWLDKWVLIPGEDWQEGMAMGLDESGTCAVCIGSKTDKGWFRQEETQCAQSPDRGPEFRVIPVILPRRFLRAR